MGRSGGNVLNEAEPWLSKYLRSRNDPQPTTVSQLAEDLARRFSVSKLVTSASKSLTRIYALAEALLLHGAIRDAEQVDVGLEDRFFAAHGDWTDAAAKALFYVSSSAARHYFALASQLEAAGLLELDPSDPLSRRGLPLDRRKGRLDVVDLATVESRFRLPIVQSVLGEYAREARLQWAAALNEDEGEDRRAPTFFVVDEAHNLLPREVFTVSERRIRDHFRTIAAEGRKYGHYLILCSQRPDKLDPVILAECDNRAVMKMASPAAMKAALKLLGITNIGADLRARCENFAGSRVLLAGDWAHPGGEILYTAARRTIEGGRNLQPQHWARR